MPGQDARDWIINNYVDLDPSGGTRDYKGSVGSSAKTYNGHRGVDIDVSTFREMDAGFPVFAAASGTVTARADGHFDRNTSCASLNWNFVELTHGNGYRTIYGHLKRNSVAVALGQNVDVGDLLGVVGSSGCSTQPHLHFEVLNASNQVVEPFQASLWVAPPVYATPLGFMDGVLRRGGISNVDQIKDPLPNATSIAAGQVLGIGLSMAGGRAGDTTTVEIRRANGTLYETLTLVFGQVYRHTYWYWNRVIDNVPGTWTIKVRTKGKLVKTYSLTVF